MPRPMDIMFKCENCGYKEIRTIGDRSPDLEELRPCPICESRMKMTNESSESFIAKFIRIFKFR